MFLTKVESAKVPLLKFTYCLDKDIRFKSFQMCQEKVDFDLLFASVKKSPQTGGYDIHGHGKLLDDMNEFSMNREQLATFTSLTGAITSICEELPISQQFYCILLYL
jgi:hypothetical protein